MRLLLYSCYRDGHFCLIQNCSYRFVRDERKSENKTILFDSDETQLC